MQPGWGDRCRGKRSANRAPPLSINLNELWMVRPGSCWKWSAPCEPADRPAPPPAGDARIFADGGTGATAEAGEAGAQAPALPSSLYGLHTRVRRITKSAEQTQPRSHNEVLRECCWRCVPDAALCEARAHFVIFCSTRDCFSYTWSSSSRPDPGTW